LNKEEIRILTPSGMLGYGIPEMWFQKGLEMKPDAITVDSGSTDSGPQKLGLGDMTCTFEAYYKELQMLLDACHARKIPLYVSSAGGDGTNAHVDIFVDMITKIAKEKGYHFNIAVIYSEIDKEYVKRKIRQGQVTPCGPLEDLTAAEVDQATTIVAQMGVEPYIKALKNNDKINIIIAGRSYDPCPTAVLGIMNGFDSGLCWHMGKIMECGALCAEPSGRNIFGILRKDHFILEPLNPEEKCKTYSVAAHTLYEKSHPYLLPGPGGVLDLSGCQFEQITERSVKVSGSKFIPKEYAVKLEGAKKVGFRTLCVAGVRDPILIGQIDGFLDGIRADLDQTFADIKGDYQVIFHVYGRDGVMGELEPERERLSKELCIIIEVVSSTQKRANEVCNRARIYLLHNPYQGRIATAGNIGLPFTPLELPIGEVCKFNVYHLMKIVDPVELFPIKYLEV
jgi:hypothetical protein